jgi:hypothetical protein
MAVRLDYQPPLASETPDRESQGLRRLVAAAVIVAASIAIGLYAFTLPPRTTNLLWYMGPHWNRYVTMCCLHSLSAGLSFYGVYCAIVASPRIPRLTPLCVLIILLGTLWGLSQLTT